jgi:1-acyl-sn-glycerol-3-phosphate acyltransferase
MPLNCNGSVGNGVSVCMRDRSNEYEQASLHDFRERSLTRGVNPLLYWTIRAIFVPFFLVYFRLQRTGSEHLPRSGPLLLASNHRSFLDPFVIGTLVRRPVYYMAKRELFGAFPVDRGAGDAQAMETAEAILARGDCVVLFPEGTRVRPGPLGAPRKGVGRLALQTGVPVVPIAVIGTEDVRSGWRIRPRRVRIRVGSPLLFPKAEDASPSRATAVTERIWACVSLQWAWLGGAVAPSEDGEHTQREPARRRRVHQKSSPDDGDGSPAREEARAA